MSQLKVKKAPVISTELRVPGDKSISHRAAIFSALSNGTCLVTGFLPSEDCMRTVKILRELGIKIEHPDETTLIIEGRKRHFDPPTEDLDCGNSGTTMRLFSGLLAGQPFSSRLVGDSSLSGRPMARVVDPLTLMGADIQAEGEGGCAPLRITGSELQGIIYDSPVASAQVKSAVLLAGMFAKDKTTVTEPMQSRDHTEKMLEYYLVSLLKGDHHVSIYGGQMPESRNFHVPGDISSAAFWLVAAAAQPGAHIIIEDVGLNETRTSILNVLVRMGARVREVIEDVDQVERIGSIEIKGTVLHGTVIEGQEIPNLIDELPVIAVAGALAEGNTLIRQAEELRVKESDRIHAVATNLRAMGVEVIEYQDGMEIVGGSQLIGAKLSSFGDHRIAMAFAIAGLFATGETIIDDADCIATSYPQFESTLRSIMKPASKAASTPVISNIGNTE